MSTIHQAVFGDVRGAHNLIAASPNAPEDAVSDLAWLTDRLLPADIQWDPYTCGYSVRQFFALTRTFRVRASRTGMVQTHVVLVPLLECSTHKHLRAFLDLLPTEPTVPERPPQLKSIPLVSVLVPFLPPPVPVGYPSVVRALIQGRTPVWFGQTGFEEVVCSLWYRLWPDARRALKFGARSDANQLVDFPVSIAQAPESLRLHWQQSHAVDQTATSLSNESLAEALLLGSDRALLLAEKLGRLDVPFPLLTALPRLEDYTRLIHLDTADGIRAAMRLLGAIAPKPEQAAEEKLSVLIRLQEKTREGSESDVVALRNLDISTTATGSEILYSSALEWLQAHLNEDGAGNEIIKHGLQSESPWARAVQRAVASLLLQWDDRVARCVWHWMTGNPALILHLGQMIPIRDDVERKLVTWRPRCLADAVVEPLLTLASTRRWLMLHAATLAASAHPSFTKFRMQIQVDSDTAHTEALDLLCADIAAAELLTVALELDDERLRRRVGRLAVDCPGLMAPLDGTHLGWLAIWGYRVSYGGQPCDGLENPTGAIHALLDGAIDRQHTAIELLSSVVVLPEANVLTYPRRSQIWQLSVLPSAVRLAVLSMTAKAWLRRFIDDARGVLDEPLEADLRGCILAEWRAARTQMPSSRIGAFLDSFPAELAQDDAEAWFDAATMPFQPFEAVSMGRVLKARGWKRVAAKLADQARRGRSDLVGVLRECTDLLGIRDRLRLTFLLPNIVLTEDEWWHEFLEQCAYLYPHGVRDQWIWHLAGGDEAKIREGNGREQWVNALQLLRKGGGGEYMRIEGLLHQMRRHFGKNSDLKIIEDVFLSKFAKGYRDE